MFHKVFDGRLVSGPPPVHGGVDDESIIVRSVDAIFSIVVNAVIMYCVILGRTFQQDSDVVPWDCVVQDSVVIRGTEMDAIIAYLQSLGHAMK